jgi:predicted extracellular nuclease
VRHTERRPTSSSPSTSSGLAREATELPADQEIAVATFNVENLDPSDLPSKFASLADIFVDNLRSPDIVSVEEVHHWKSKGGDQPLFGRFQPPALVTEAQRTAEAEVVNGFVDEILDVDPNANVVVLGDLNDFEFPAPLTALEGGGDLHTLIESLPPGERYSYVFDGNSQTLDHIAVSENLFSHFPFEYDSVHVNAEFADQASDHDPQVVRFRLTGRPTP